MQRAYLQSTQVLSALLCGLGIAMVATTLLRGGGPLTLGVLLGAMLAVLGAGRMALARGRRPPDRR